MVRIRVIDEILRMLAFAAASCMVVFALCEYVLKPLWHLIQMRLK